MKWFLQLACIVISVAANGFAADEPRPLVDAIADLNSRAAKDGIGKVQPPLTEAEVVAAIRGWIRARTPVNDETYFAFQTIATTGLLPDRASLGFTTHWSGYNGFDFDVWWVDLTIMTGEKTLYAFRIRDQKIASRPAAPRVRQPPAVPERR